MPQTEAGQVKVPLPQRPQPLVSRTVFSETSSYPPPSLNWFCVGPRSKYWLSVALTSLRVYLSPVLLNSG